MLTLLVRTDEWYTLPLGEATAAARSRSLGVPPSPATSMIGSSSSEQPTEASGDRGATIVFIIMYTFFLGCEGIQIHTAPTYRQQPALINNTYQVADAASSCCCCYTDCVFFVYDMKKPLFSPRPAFGTPTECPTVEEYYYQPSLWSPIITRETLLFYQSAGGLTRR